MTTNGRTRLEPLVALLNGVQRKTESQELWPSIASKMSQTLHTRSQVESAILSPSGDHVAVCIETKNWLGLKTRQAGLLYAIKDNGAIGRIVTGKRGTDEWVLEKVI